MKKSVAGILVGAACMLALLSGAAYQRLSSYTSLFEGVDPGFDSVHVTIGGWPLPFLEDKLHTSPVGSVSATGGLIGLDRFMPWPFLADVAFYTALLLLSWTLANRLIRRTKTRSR